MYKNNTLVWKSDITHNKKVLLCQSYVGLVPTIAPIVAPQVATDW